MKKVGRYVIISELGRGAMGIVYKASDPTIDREVALKVLSLNASHEEGTNSPQEMFMREVRAAGRLAHPSIVTIYDAFEEQEHQTSCIVMELVPGLTLEKTLHSGRPMSTQQMLSIIRQVAEALDYAHRNQVIHRDLKPANILVTEDGRAKITDFGIAKVLAREGIARTVGIMGTPSFMSPEQVRGGEIDARTDIFSLGIIIFTMLAGQKPFSGNPAAVMFKIVYEEPPLPSTLNPQLSPAFDQVIKKCLAKDRDLRYASARELLGDLDDLEHGRPPRSHPVASVAAPIQPPPVSAAPSRITSPPLKPYMPPVSAVHKEGGPAPHTTVPVPALPGSGSREPVPPVSALDPAQLSKPAAPLPVKPTSASDAGALPAKTVVMRVPDLSEVSSSGRSSPPAYPAPPAAAEFADREQLERTVRTPAPEFSTESPESYSSLPAEAAPFTAPDSTALEKTAPISAPPKARVGPEGTAGELPARHSKLSPLIIGGVAVVLLVAGAAGFWKFNKSRIVPPPVHVEVQQLPLTPPPISTDLGTFPSVPSTEQPPPAVPPDAEVPKKAVVHKQKQASATHPIPSPEPPPPQPQPVIPAPTPDTPSQEDIARAEAAKLANAPHILQVVCSYGFKEATFTFSSGGKTVYQDTSKGKKKKAGFLGIKGTYEGSFTHAITLPAGASEVSLHVVSGDGATDLNKAIKMLPPGGFVPTLIVKVDSENLTLHWKGASAEK